MKKSIDKLKEAVLAEMPRKKSARDKPVKCLGKTKKK
jgi:hypothetical protein